MPFTYPEPPLTLRAFLVRRFATRSLGVVAMNHHVLTNDLRLRVLEGDTDIEAVEMLSIVDDIRQGRRSAARASPDKPSSRRAKSAPAPLAAEDLRAILDQDL